MSINSKVVKIKLINAIEIEPHEFVTDDITISYPTDSTIEKIHQYYSDYWQATPFCELNRIYSNSFLVDMNDIDGVIPFLIEKEFENIDLDDNEIHNEIYNDESELFDYICKLTGGIVISHNDEMFICPSCCGDVSNISEWLQVLETDSPDWQVLWNGHPSIFYRVVNDTEKTVEFAHQQDEMQPASDKIQAELQMSFVDFERQIKQMEEEQMQLRDRFIAYLNQMSDSRIKQNSRTIANIICGISDED